MALDLFQLAAFAEILGAGSIAFALIFGAFQLHQYRRERRDRGAAELMHMFQTRDYVDGYLEIVALPESITAESIRSRGAEFEKTAAAVSLLLEELGILVYNRTIPLAFVNLAMGGFLRISWYRLKPWIEDERRRLNAPTFGEWFQWLVNRLEENPTLKKEPAYVKYRRWQA